MSTDFKGPLPFLRNGIEQLALVVEDLDKSVETYWKLFGVGPWHIYTYGKPLVKKMSYHGEPADYSMRLALTHIGSLRIELIEVVHGDLDHADFVKQHGYGVHHFGVLVEDMETALAQAEAAGFSSKTAGAGFGADGDGHYAYLDTEDALGVTLELIQLPKRRVPPDSIYPPGYEA